jgi:hypothetical protein
MPVQTLLIGLAAIALIVLARQAWVWNRYRGRRLIQCPENLRPAGVVVDAKHAAATAIGWAPELRLSSCTRWPERHNCGQECLSQVQAAPGDCLVRHILIEWYRGKTCVSCGLPFADIEWSRKPALLTPEQKSLEWDDIPVEKLSEVLAASKPLCFACYMASRLVQEHPELVADRSAR